MSVTATREPRARARAEVREARRPQARPGLLAAALIALFAAAAVYHWLQSRGHVTPAVFTDELLFAELARSFASGDGFSVRGEPLFLPAFVPIALQAPVWLVDSTPLAYGLAKTLNTALMCLSVFPAYWLARQLVRPAYALAGAAATVAGGGMLYHSYLTSEAAAYPVFLLAVAVSVRALAAPGRRWELLTLGVLVLAVLTRAQFVALPLIFALAVPLVALVRRERIASALRVHALSLGGLALIGAAVLVRGWAGAGFYSGASQLDYPLLETLRWSAWTAALLPFAAGLLVVPGALLGLGYALRRPRTRADAAFGVVTALALVAAPLQAGLIASGEAHKPLERYVFYLLPLVFIAFFAYVERGAPGRRLHAAVALGLGGLALVIPFASLALDPFSFDSPTLSAVEALGRWTTPGDAATIFAGAGLLAALAAAALHRSPVTLAAGALLLAFLVGAAAYSGDRRMTRRTLAPLAPAQESWLERSGIPEADFLALTGGSLHFGWMLESWNRNVGRTLHLGDVPSDPLPYADAQVRADGTLVVAGEPVRSRHLVVNDFGSRMELSGERLASPLRGLTLYRTMSPVRVRTLADGLYADGWARSVVRFRAWPGQRARGVYRVRLSLPAQRPARVVELRAGDVERRLELTPAGAETIRLPVSGFPLPELEIRTDRADFVDGGTPRPRLVATRIDALEFVLDTGSRNW